MISSISSFRDYLNINGDMDLDFGGPTVNAAAVLGYGKWVAGTQLAFDTAGSKLTKTNFAIGHLGGDFEVNLFLNDGANFSGSLFQKVVIAHFKGPVDLLPMYIIKVGQK